MFGPFTFTFTFTLESEEFEKVGAPDEANKCWAIILPKSRNNGRALIISSFHFKATRGFIYLSKNGIIKPKIFHSIPISVAKHLGNVFPCTLTFTQKIFFFGGGGRQ